jgi:hypothetical protein
MLCREIINVYSKDRKNFINAISGQNTELFNVNVNDTQKKSYSVFQRVKHQPMKTNGGVTLLTIWI